VTVSSDAGAGGEEVTRATSATPVSGPLCGRFYDGRVACFTKACRLPGEKSLSPR
jgi:hypothetical protein